MRFVLVTEDTSQPFRGWLKTDASRNMEYMVVTEDTFQRLRSLLKSDADQNMNPMSVTEDTSQAPMFGLHVSRTSALAQRRE